MRALSWLLIFGPWCGLRPTASAQLALATTGPLVLSLPAFDQSPPRIFLRVPPGHWQPAVFQLQEESVVFTLDPAQLGGSKIMLLINPPAGLVLDDYTPPRVTRLVLDGRPLRSAEVVDLGALRRRPRQLEAMWTDSENAIAQTSLQAQLDGAPLVLSRAQTSGKKATVRLFLPALEYGAHELMLVAADASPQRNSGRLRLRFEYIETGNVALASLGATVRVDSCFPNYESLTPINDGQTKLSGVSCGNDVTWASAETPTDHWVEITLPKPTRLREVTIYWAAYTDVAHTPRHFEIQIPENDGWRSVYGSPPEGEKPSPVTTARFAPVKTRRFRVFMPAGQGSATRPNLLWVAEIKAR